MESLKHLEGLISGKINLIKALLNLFKLEAKLAGLSVYPLILNICLLFIVLITLWLSIMSLIGYLIFSFFPNPLAVISLIALTNLSLLIGLLYYLSFNLKNMSFAKTRAYFAQKENSHHDSIKETINCSDSTNGKKITAPTK